MTAVTDHPTDEPNLDPTDRALIELLTADGRLPVAGLAARLGLARSTVQQRLARLEARGVIAGYTIRRGVGADRGVHARISIVVDGRRADTVVAALEAIPALRRLFAVSGPIDLVADIECDRPADLDATIDRIGAIPGVLRTETAVVLATKIDR
jgi:DNA-binding Lrp family transcriptional regulator